jgi:hypothetical protein
MYRVDTFRMANIKGVFGTGKYFPRFLRRRPDARLDELPSWRFYPRVVPFCVPILLNLQGQGCEA